MNARLTRKIRELGAKNGVDLIGIAPIERFAEAPDGHKPQNILPSAKTVVSIALNALEGTFSTELFHTYQLSYALLRSRTNDISYQLAKYLESEGYSSFMKIGRAHV